MPMTYRNDIENPLDYSYDPLGRGANPLTALLFEAQTNRPLYPNGLFEQLLKDEIYPVNPSFINPQYGGSGTYFYTKPYEGKILINKNRPLNLLLNEIIPHEILHRQTGAMGGYIRGNRINQPEIDELDRFILQYEEPWALPQERLAYSGGQLPAIIKYFLRGDLRRGLEGYE